MIKSILLATDGSEHAWSAWQYALDMARAYRALFRILSIVDSRVLATPATVPLGGFDPLNLAPAYAVELEEELHSKHTRVLDEVRERTADSGVAVETMLVRGDPAHQILSSAPTADLVAMGHQGERSAWERLWIGSVAEAVVRGSPRPVLVAPRRYSPVTRILAAYDGSAPARRALQFGAGLAATLETDLEVVNVNRKPHEGHEILREAREFLRPYTLRHTYFNVREGDAAEQLLETADRMGAGLIVMGAHSRPRVVEAFVGSTTQAMLQEMDRPVIMVK